VIGSIRSGRGLASSNLTARDLEGLSGGGGGGGVPDLAALTIWRESIDDFSTPIGLSAGKVVLWPNRGALGSAGDWVPIPALPTPDYEVGAPSAVYFNAADVGLSMAAATGGIWALPAGGVFAPFTCFAVDTIEASSQRESITDFRITSFTSPMFIAPTTPNFNLVWQYLGDPVANVQTSVDPSALIVGKRAIFMWKWDGTTLVFKINGAPFALTNSTNLTGPSGPAPILYDLIRGTLHVRQYAWMIWNVALTPTQEADAFNYLAGRYPPTA
jgi:hypothetical protein